MAEDEALLVGFLGTLNDGEEFLEGLGKGLSGVIL
jgi:hypothetical protein